MFTFVFGWLVGKVAKVEWFSGVEGFALFLIFIIAFNLSVAVAEVLGLMGVQEPV